MSYTPSRFRPELVYRFVPYLKQIINGSPSVKFSPSDVHLNEASAIARVRDAVIALTKEIVFHPDIDANVLAKVWSNYKVVFDQIEQCVCICLRRTDVAKTNGGKNDLVELTFRVEEPDFERGIEACAWLLSRHHIRGFVTILGMLDNDFQERLTNDFNVYFRQLGPNEYLMT